MNSGKRLIAAAAIVATLALVCCGQARTWTDATGKYSIQAELVEVQGGKVVLKKPDGRSITVPLEKLTAADQAYAKRHTPTAGRAAGSTGQPVWTLDVAKMKIPDQPAGGLIHGHPFKPDRAQFKQDNDWLELRQGKDLNPDLSLAVVVFTDAGQTLEGRTFRITPKDSEGLPPHVILQWRDKGTRSPDSKTFMGVMDDDDKYAMILEYGKKAGGKLPGRIYVCLPDKEHSVVAGTFAIALPGQTSEAGTGTISGTVRLPLNLSDLKLWIGCLGKNAEGKLEGPAVGVDLTERTTSGSCMTWKPRETLVKWTRQGRRLTHRHTNRPPGIYLVDVQGHERTAPDGAILHEGYYDWKWVELKAGQPNATVDLTVDPKRLGTLEVNVRGSTREHAVVYVPLNEDGELPIPEALGYSRMSSFAKLQDGRAVIRNLRQGKYRIAIGPWRRYSPTATAVAEVKAGRTTKAELTVPAHEASTPPARATSGLPDLQVTRLYLKEVLRGGRKVRYKRAMVRNNGPGPATNVTTNFLVDGKLTDVDPRYQFKPGEEKHVSASALPPGTHTVKVVVDPDNKIKETDETNNSMEATLPASVTP